MEKIYEARFIKIGPLASEFMDHNILVLFGESAPEELMEFAIIHDGDELSNTLSVDDIIEIGGEPFRVLAVGEVANKNLATLGHLILKCNGKTIPEMPGDVCLEEKSLPPIKIGTTLNIYRSD